MGSTGSGSFTDYSGAKNKVNGEGNISGGESGIDICQVAFGTSLEDVALYSYYRNHSNIPPVATKVGIIFSSRIIAYELSSGLEIGALPTKYNYLLACIENGFIYQGVVTKSINSSHPQVSIDVGAI